MKQAIVVQGLGKKFYRYQADRPATVLATLARGFRGWRPEEVFWGLRDVSFSVAPGQIIGVIGENGAGKSTLLRLIGGVGRPDEGTVRVNGRIGGFLDLKAGLRPDLTGRENVYVGGVIAGLTRREVDECFDAIVAFAGVGAFIDTPLRAYSTGMGMRLAFAIAAHTNPDILLVDEVLAVGDEAFRHKCFQRLEAFKVEGCTILIASHQTNQLLDLCDEVIWLHEGRLQAHGDPEMVITQYTTVVSARQQEIIRHGPNNRAEATGPRHRFGTQEMEIISVNLLDTQGRPVTAFESGTPLSIVLKYHAKQPIIAPVFNITITRDHQVCCTLNTATAQLPMSALEGEGQLQLDLERLDLVAGLYHVDVGVYEQNWKYAYDYHWHVYPLYVRATGSNKGMLHPPHRWTVHTPLDGACACVTIDNH